MYDCGLRGRQQGAIPPAPVAELYAWLAEVRACGIGAIATTFATGLKVDGAAPLTILLPVLVLLREVRQKTFRQSGPDCVHAQASPDQHFHAALIK